MKANNELEYRGILCKQVGSKGWKIVIGQSEYLYPTFADAKAAINALHEECSRTCCGEQLMNNAGVKGKKKGHPVLIVVIVLLFFVFISSGNDSNDALKATSAPTHTAVATAKATAKPTTAPTSTPTAKPTEAPTATPFTVEHDEEYYATQDYIYKFLTEKGYEVQTIIGVPNIGRYSDDTPDDLTVPWYAIVKHKGEWTEFVVLLFNGEVSAIRPNK